MTMLLCRRPWARGTSSRRVGAQEQVKRTSSMNTRGSRRRGHLSKRCRRRASATLNLSSTPVCSTATQLRLLAISLFPFDGDANADLSHASSACCSR